MRHFLLLGAVVLIGARPEWVRAQRDPARERHAAPAAVYVDRDGVLRWRDDTTELALFGANYTLPSASDYRAAGYLALDRKALIDEDMAHFARMGWTAVRLSFWGDWENSDRAGNLLVNDHLDLLDYLVAQARKRGLYMLLSPIVTYDALWPDSLQSTAPRGFSGYYDKAELGTSDAAIAAQVNYLKQLLNHVNPYTGTALKDESAIPFVELINEPAHHSRDVRGSVRYINTLVDAVRSTGSRQILFYNVSQDFAIGESVRQSRAQGVTFGWYPTGLNSGHELQGNYLRAVDDYPPMRAPELRGLPRIVYEFDSPDSRTGYMYPAMVRAFRGVGAQLAAMFAYDMLATASRNLGWQTHYLNLVYTPRKAMSAVIAAEAMRRLPRMKSYGGYPTNTRFGDVRVSYDENLAELVAPDAFLYAGTTHTAPAHPELLSRIAGYGSSPVVMYKGEGVYFLDKIRDGLWRLEVYPDAVPLDDPFVMPNPAKVVTRAIYRAWPMRITLPDLGPRFTLERFAPRGVGTEEAQGGQLTITPGVWILSARGRVDRATLPDRVGRLRFDEFHAPAPDRSPLTVLPADARELPERLDDRAFQILANVVSPVAVDSVTLAIRPAGAGSFQRYPMQAAGGYEYRASLPVGALRDGLYEYVITVVDHAVATTFPDGTPMRAWEWDFTARHPWRLLVVPPRAPVRLFEPVQDVGRLAFTRIGNNARQGIFRLVSSARSGEPAFHFERPVLSGWSPNDYTVSLVVKDRICARGETVALAQSLRVGLRGLGGRQVLHVAVMEKDGTTWGTAIAVDSSWTDRAIPLSEFTSVPGVLLPEGFPGEWNYWVGPAHGRGGRNDGVRPADIERIQLALRSEPASTPPGGPYGVEIEFVTLTF